MTDNTVKVKFHNHSDLKLKTKNDRAGKAIVESINQLPDSMSNDIDEVEFNHGDLVHGSLKEILSKE